MCICHEGYRMRLRCESGRTQVKGHLTHPTPAGSAVAAAGPWAESSWVGGVAGDSGMPESEAEAKGGDSGRAAAPCASPCSLADLKESDPSCNAWPRGCQSCSEQQSKMQAMARQLSRPGL